jgi:4-hydroxybenzoyl-CoA thioesterase
MNVGTANTARARFEKRERIRFGHCDPAGIVFYPQYFVLFNALVEDWVSDRLGIAYAELIGARRTGMPTVSLTTDFRAISRVGDEVRLGLEVHALGTTSITLALDCLGAGRELRVAARQVIVTTSLDTHRAVAVPHDLREAIKRFALATH